MRALLAWAFVLGLSLGACVSNPTPHPQSDVYRGDGFTTGVNGEYAHPPGMKDNDGDDDMATGGLADAGAYADGYDPAAAADVVGGDAVGDAADTGIDGGDGSGEVTGGDGLADFSGAAPAEQRVDDGSVW